MTSSPIFNSVPVEKKHPIRFMGVINLSPESFYQGSVHVQAKPLLAAAQKLVREGADFLDLGAMSTAPYLHTRISEKEEMARMAKALKILRKKISVPLSVDTTRSAVARAALKEGADIVNYVGPCPISDDMIDVFKKASGVILMATPNENENRMSHPIADVKNILSHYLKQIQEAGISKRKLIVDPGIGFFRKTKWPWWKWDLSVLKNLSQLHDLGCPILVALSRKSFIGEIVKEPNPDHRLAGSLGGTVMAVFNGAHIIRTHDVQATRQAVAIAHAIQKAS